MFLETIKIINYAYKDVLGKGTTVGKYYLPIN